MFLDFNSVLRLKNQKFIILKCLALGLDDQIPNSFLWFFHNQCMWNNLLNTIHLEYHQSMKTIFLYQKLHPFAKHLPSSLKLYFNADSIWSHRNLTESSPEIDRRRPEVRANLPFPLRIWKLKSCPSTVCLPLPLNSSFWLSLPFVVLFKFILSVPYLLSYVNIIK